jgi:hypothetical protein
MFGEPNTRSFPSPPVTMLARVLPIRVSSPVPPMMFSVESAEPGAGVPQFPKLSNASGFGAVPVRSITTPSSVADASTVSPVPGPPQKSLNDVSSVIRNVSLPSPPTTPSVPGSPVIVSLPQPMIVPLSRSIVRSGEDAELTVE